MSAYARSIENLEAVRRLDQVRGRVEASGGEPDVSDMFEIEVAGVKMDCVIRCVPHDLHRFEHPALDDTPPVWNIRS